MQSSSPHSKLKQIENLTIYLDGRIEEYDFDSCKWRQINSRLSNGRWSILFYYYCSIFNIVFFVEVFLEIIVTFKYIW